MTNVLLDVATRDERWALWSVSELAAAETGPLLINDIVYAELAVRYERIEEVDDLSPEQAYSFARFPSQPCFWPPRLAGHIASVAAREPVCFPISSSGLMLRWRACLC